jgi:predicted nucleic-acid-binding Zn-ribbon protein
MPEFLKQQVFFGLRFIDVLVLVAGVIVVISVLGRLFARFRDEQIKAHFARIKCLQCGWTGAASKHTLRCPKCGNRSLSPG